MNTRARWGLVLLLVLAGGQSQVVALQGQQVVDSTYRPRPRVPAYATGSGPRVGVDAAHNNPSLDATLLPLRRLLEADGYSVTHLSAGFGPSELAGTDIVVIIDAISEQNIGNWTLPTPSPIGSADREALVDWIRAGGALLLVADHMPFAGAVRDLGAVLGLEILNGFAIDTVSWDPITFRGLDGTLRNHSIVAGRTEAERVDSVFTYWGHAFRATSASAADLLQFPTGVVSMQPREAWRFDTETEVLPVGGWSQGTALSIGKGRVVVLGDSGMLTAHLVGPRRQPIGLNGPGGGQNEQFVLNVLRWLSGTLD